MVVGNGDGDADFGGGGVGDGKRRKGIFVEGGSGVWDGLRGGGLRKFFSSYYPSARVEGPRVQRLQKKRLSVTVLNVLIEM